MSALAYGYSNDWALTGPRPVRRPSIRPLERGECYVDILLATGEKYARRIGRHMGVGRVTLEIGGARVRATKQGNRWTYTPSREGER